MSWLDPFRSEAGMFRALVYVVVIAAIVVAIVLIVRAIA
jgi:hypothetical protein